MGFQSGMNQMLGAAAGAAFAIKGEAEKKESKESALKVEGAQLAVTEAEQAVAKKRLEKDVSAAQELANKTAADSKGKYRDVESGKFINKKEGEKRAVLAAQELEKRQDALSILQKKIAATTIQRQDWKRRVGGLR